MKLDKQSLSALVKLLIFLLITSVATLFLALLLTNGSFGDRHQYKATFTDVTGVNKGDDVRIAGVAVGNVKDIKIVDRDKAVLTFGVDTDVRLTGNTDAQLKYRNLVGQRYLSLSQGAEGSKSTLKPGGMIPLSRTKNALDLNVLFNGFKPVFKALSPKDTNKLAFELVQTLQGEGGNVKDLLARTSSLTNTLAGRDKLIGDVITNLNDTLDIVGSRDKELSQTIDTLQQFATGLKDDREAILGSIDSISGLAVETSDLLAKGRPGVATDIKQLDRLTGNLSKPKNIKNLRSGIEILPIKMKKLSSAAASGSEFNFFLCEIRGTIALPKVAGIKGLGGQKLVIGGKGGNGVSIGGKRCDPTTTTGGADK